MHGKKIAIGVDNALLTSYSTAGGIFVSEMSSLSVNRNETSVYIKVEIGQNIV